MLFGVNFLAHVPEIQVAVQTPPQPHQVAGASSLVVLSQWRRILCGATIGLGGRLVIRSRAFWSDVGLRFGR